MVGAVGLGGRVERGNGEPIRSGDADERCAAHAHLANGVGDGLSRIQSHNLGRLRQLRLIDDAQLARLVGDVRRARSACVHARANSLFATVSASSRMRTASAACSLVITSGGWIRSVLEY